MSEMMSIRRYVSNQNDPKTPRCLWCMAVFIIFLPSYTSPSALIHLLMRALLLIIAIDLWIVTLVDTFMSYTDISDSIEEKVFGKGERTFTTKPSITNATITAMDCCGRLC